MRRASATGAELSSHAMVAVDRLKPRNTSRRSRGRGSSTRGRPSSCGARPRLSPPPPLLFLACVCARSRREFEGVLGRASPRRPFLLDHVPYRSLTLDIDILRRQREPDREPSQPHRPPRARRERRDGVHQSCKSIERWRSEEPVTLRLWCASEICQIRGQLARVIRRWRANGAQARSHGTRRISCQRRLSHTVLLVMHESLVF